MEFKIDNKIYISTGEHTAIRKDVFENKFDGKYDFEYLSNHENCSERWQEIFNYWKNEGFIQ